MFDFSLSGEGTLTVPRQQWRHSSHPVTMRARGSAGGPCNAAATQRAVPPAPNSDNAPRSRPEMK